MSWGWPRGLREERDEGCGESLASSATGSSGDWRVNFWRQEFSEEVEIASDRRKVADDQFAAIGFGSFGEQVLPACAAASSSRDCSRCLRRDLISSRALRVLVAERRRC